eukprot:Awhi_evm1s14316
MKLSNLAFFGLSTTAVASNINVNIQITTCGSYFINLDFECSDSGRVGAGDPNKVCNGDECFLKDCCEFAVPQFTPPKPGSVPQKVPTVIQQVPTPTTVVQKTPPVPQKTPPAPKMKCIDYYDENGRSICTDNGYAHRRNGSIECAGSKCKLDECCKGMNTPPEPKPTKSHKKPIIDRVVVDCANRKRCRITIHGENFDKHHCHVDVYHPTWKQKEPLEILDGTLCREDKIKATISYSIAKEFDELNINVNNPDFPNNWSNPYLIELDD